MNAANAAASASIENLHTEVDATVNAVQEHLETVEPATAPETAPIAMRAKMLVVGMKYSTPGDPRQFNLDMIAVGGDKVQHGYPPDGSDEDNTFAHWSPSGSLSLSVVNPALFGKIKEGEKYYLDFTLANAAPAEVVPEPSSSSSSSSSSSAAPTPEGEILPASNPLTAADFPGGVMPTAPEPIIETPASSSSSSSSSLSVVAVEPPPVVSAEPVPAEAAPVGESAPAN
ncbi:MAG: hypothetical protein ABJF10_21290 [Chthoniobacter sp.]|uniref:hypothetical protein n=1 Tax=Chthoniobacter sp. TaxID=2510640 RepID=UPI0032A448D7